MDPTLRARLEEVYSTHPVAADHVLRRIQDEKGTLDGLSARDLAEAPLGGPTDHNHVGGADAERRIASAVGLTSEWRVLDIGTGLGGTPRILAEECRCRCHGVELTASRFRDAIRLTRLTRLEDLVTFTHGDFLTVPIPGAPFDLAIAQGSLMHMPDLPGALQRVWSLLRPGGRLVIEDGVIVQQPGTAPQAQSIAELLEIWNGAFRVRDDWRDLLADARFRLDCVEDLSAAAIEDFRRLRGEFNSDGRTNAAIVTRDERRGWDLALRLLGSGHLAIVRLFATRE